MGLYNPLDEENQNQQAYFTQGAGGIFEKPTEEDQSLSFQQHAKLQSRTAENMNWVASLVHNGLGDWSKSDPNYNPYPKIQGTKYENYASEFSLVDNDEELQARMKDVDEREEYQDLASKAPSTAFWSSMAWGVLDPALVVPGFGAVKVARAAKAGQQVMKTATINAGITGGVMAGEEAILHAGNPERTATESAINIAASSLVAGTIGGLVGYHMMPEIAVTPKLQMKPIDEAVAIPEKTDIQSLVPAVEEVKPVPAAINTDISLIRPTINDMTYYLSDKEWDRFVSAAEKKGLKYSYSLQELPVSRWSKQEQDTYNMAFGRDSFSKIADLAENNVLTSPQLVLKETPEFLRKKHISTMAETHNQAKQSVSKVLEVSEDSIPVDMPTVEKNINTAGRMSISDIVEEHNMAGHTSPFMRKWEMDHPYEDGKIVPQEGTLAPEDLKPVDEKELADALAPKGAVVGDESQSIGAGHVTYDARIARLPNWALKMMSIPGVRPPVIVGMTDPSGLVRDFTTRTFPMHLPLEQNLKGIATPISLFSRKEQDMLKALDWNAEVDRAWLQYMNVDPDSMLAGAKGFLKSRVYNPTQKLTKKQFEDEVFRALNTGDSHAIPQVDATAKYTRKILDDVYDEAQKLGFFASDTRKKNYFKMVYDIPAIENNRVNFENALTKSFLRFTKADAVYTTPKGEERTVPVWYDTKTKEIDLHLKPGQSIKEIRVKGMPTIEEAQEAAREATDSILKVGDKSLALGDAQRLHFEVGSDSMQARKLIWDYEDVKDYLIKDMRGIMHGYLASMSNMINYKKLLDDMGVDSIQELRVKLRDEYNAKMDHIKNIKEMPTAEIKKLPKEEQNKFIDPEIKKRLIAKLGKEEKTSLKNLNDIIAVGLGQYKQRTSADPFWRITDQYNAIRLLQGVVASSLTDPFIGMIKNSVPDVLWYGWTSELRRIATGTNKLKKQDMRDALTALQGEMDDGIRFIMNPEYETYKVGRVEKMAQGAGQLASKANILEYWLNFWQRASHSVAEAQILRRMNKGWTNLSKRDQALMAEVGIDETMLSRITTMQKKYGYDIRGTHISNSRLWSDQEARLAFNNAIRLDVRKSPLFTEVGDIPLIVQRSQARKSMFLFKGYASAASTKILASVAARRDPQAMIGLTAILMAGAMTEVLKNKIKGKETDTSPTNLLRASWDRSGAGGLVLDPMFQTMRAIDAHKQFGGNAWFQEPVDYLVGPNASIASPIYAGVVKYMSGQQLDPRTEYQLKALIPYYNAGWMGMKYNKDNKNKSTDSRFGARY